MDTMPRLRLFLEANLDIRKYKDNSKEFIVCAAPSVQEEISSMFGVSEFINL